MGFVLVSLGIVEIGRWEWAVVAIKGVARNTTPQGMHGVIWPSCKGHVIRAEESSIELSQSTIG